MALRNLPTDEPKQLAELISVKPGQVSSMSLSAIDDAASLMLFAYAEGESVSEERYPQNVLYYVVEGAAEVRFAERVVPMTTGQVLMVPSGVEHAIEPISACKILQVIE